MRRYDPGEDLVVEMEMWPVYLVNEISFWAKCNGSKVRGWYQAIERGDRLKNCWGAWWLTFFLGLSACHSAGSKHQVDEDKIPIEDFGLGAKSGGRGSPNLDHYQDHERSNAAVPFQTSFPLAFAISGSTSNFQELPIQVQPPLPSRLTLRMGDCVMFLQTGPVQVRRYLFTGDWVRFGEEISAHDIQYLKKDSELNLRMASQLSLEIPSPHDQHCRQVLYGRRTFIGRYHMIHSEAQLIGDSASQEARLERAEPRDEGTKVYVHWHQNGKRPLLINDLEFPAVVKSSFYRAQLGQRGFYYVSFQPVLRMQNVNRLVIQIPLADQLNDGQQLRAPKQSSPIGPVSDSPDQVQEPLGASD